MSVLTSATATFAKNRDLAGMGLVLLGISLFSIQDVIIKEISGRYPVQQLIFLRSAISIILLVGMLAWQGKLSSLRTKYIGRHILRGSLMCLSYVAYYLAIAAMPLADAVAIYFVAPLIVTLLSVLILKETLTRNQAMALLIGFVGTIVILRPGMGVFELAGIFPIMAALLYAISVILTRRMPKTESGMAMAVYATATYLGSTALFGIFFSGGLPVANAHPSIQFMTRAWVMPTSFEFILILMTGFIGAIGFYALAQAYLIAPATVVAPFEYVMLPLSVLWGWTLWAEFPDTFTMVGTILILTGGLSLIPRRPNRRRWVFMRR